LHGSSDKNTIIYGLWRTRPPAYGKPCTRPFPAKIISRPGTYKKSDITACCVVQHPGGATVPSYQILLIEDNMEALKAAYKMTADTDAILVCGSFYLAGG
jgi:dihydrofolate synthase/folylpolyglutamate synthase